MGCSTGNCGDKMSLLANKLGSRRVKTQVNWVNIFLNVYIVILLFYAGFSVSETFLRINLFFVGGALLFRVLDYLWKVYSKNKKSGDRFQNPFGGRRRGKEVHRSKKEYSRKREKQRLKNKKYDDF